MLKYIQAVFIAVFAFLGVAPSAARAALLDATGLGLLQTHLGENVNVTNIYTKSLGERSADWHAAVDGRGRTFTLMEVTGATSAGGGGTFAGPMIVGGYNPQSWASSGGWNKTPNTADRTAFLFNLTQTIFLDQRTDKTDGAYQTYNDGQSGPAFGLGDLDLGTDMNTGWLNPLSYSDGSVNILGTGGYWHFNVGEVETYAISAVPLPPSAILFGTALFGMGAAGLRRNRKQAKKLA